MFNFSSSVAVLYRNVVESWVTHPVCVGHISHMVPDKYSEPYAEICTVPPQFTAWRNHLKFRCGSERLTDVETSLPFGLHISVTCMSKCVYSLVVQLAKLNN